MRYFLSLLAVVLCLGIAGAQIKRSDPSGRATRNTPPATRTTPPSTPFTPGLVMEIDDLNSLPTGYGKPIVIDFNAPWCGWCTKFSPIFKGMAAEMMDKAIFVSINTDEVKEAVQRFSISGIPLVVILSSDGTELDRHSGYMEASELRSFINRNL